MNERKVTRKPQSSVMTVVVKKIPRSVLSPFKSYCALRGVTLKESLTDLIRNWVIEKRKPALKSLDRHAIELPADRMMQIIIKGFPRSLFNAFKAQCILYEVTMRDSLIDIIREKMRTTKEE